METLLANIKLSIARRLIMHGAGGNEVINVNQCSLRLQRSHKKMELSVIAANLSPPHP